MRKYNLILGLMVLATVCSGQADGSEFNGVKDLQITGAAVTYLQELELIVFEIDVAGEAGKSIPQAAGRIDGAPVLGYVFPTTLKSTDVGFGATDGIVALAVTSHPDFDDTPLWDENNDTKYGNDGVVFHTHWVVLQEDKRVPGGLAVKQFKMADHVTLPPTNPGMHMYMDSPGYGIVLSGKTLKVIVPLQRINFQKEFKYDAVAAFMRVNTSDDNKPMLGVYQVYSVLSGNLSLPYQVK